jgi:hypothetical protein
MTIASMSAAKGRRAGLGIWLAGIYVALVVGLFILTALTTNPGKVGLDWIPFMVLTAPWSGMSPAMAVPGILLNAAIMWLAGTVLHKIIRAS